MEEVDVEERDDVEGLWCSLTVWSQSVRAPTARSSAPFGGATAGESRSRKSRRLATAASTVRHSAKSASFEHSATPTSSRSTVSYSRPGRGSLRSLLDVLSRPHCLLLVLEHMDCDLRRYISTEFAAIDQTTVKTLMFQLMQGVSYLHARRILHRDLKAQNILFNPLTCTAKIADFGLARKFSLPLRPYTPEVVTLWYRAPELLLGMKTYSYAVDMWSLGCIFLELSKGEPPFRGQSELDQILKIFQVMGTPDAALWPGIDALPFSVDRFPQWRAQSLEANGKLQDPQGLDLLSKMLRYDPQQRISAADALQHPYFRDLKPEGRDRALQPTSATNRDPLAAVDLAHLTL